MLQKAEVEEAEGLERVDYRKQSREVSFDDGLGHAELIPPLVGN